VTYNRKKDRQKGWYISYWTFNRKRVKDILASTKKEEIAKLSERLLKEEINQNSYFICPNLCMRLDFEQATDLDYKCPECGQLLRHLDNSKTIRHLREKIKELEKNR
jgi:transcription initiation factor TFIIE subunit alpha